MRPPWKTSAAILAALLASAPAPAAALDFSSQAGGAAGGEFLLFDIGARGIGMGGAYTAVTDDAYSIYWNPAGLTRVPRFSAAFMHSQYIQDISYQTAEFAYRVNDVSVIAAGWRYMDIGNIEQIDSNNVDRGEFRPKVYVGEIGWGQRIYDLSDNDMDLSVGAAARWIHSDFIEHGDGVGGDIGTQARFYVGSKIYDLGFVIQNLGIGQKFDRTRETMPLRVRIGGALYPLRPLTLSMDYIMAINNDPALAIGGEYTQALPRDMKLMLRAGFNSSTSKDLGPFSTLSLGMGFKVTDITMDYAYKPFGVLGTNAVHRLSISYNLPKRISGNYRER